MSLKYTNFNVTKYTSESSTSHTFLIENIGVIDTSQSYLILNDIKHVTSVVISCGPLHLEIDVNLELYADLLDKIKFPYMKSANSLNLIPFFFDRYFPVFKFKGMLRLTFYLFNASEMSLQIYRRPEKYFSGSTYKFLYSQIFKPITTNFIGSYRPFIRPFCFKTNDENVDTIDFLVNEYSIAKGIDFYEFPPYDQLDDTSYVKVINSDATTASTHHYMLTAKGYIDFSEDVVKVCEGVKNDDF